MADVAAVQDNQLAGQAPIVPIDMSGQSMAMQIMFDDYMYERASRIATRLAGAKGFTPGHLLQNTDACFAVVVNSMTWKLSPYAVANATFQTPGGKVGYEGKLCQAILENSGHLVGPVKFEHFGDWSKVFHKFEIKTSQKGRQYAAATYNDKDEEGLGVVVSCQVRDEAQPREFEFFLSQAFPRNSTLWATDPKTQICYTGVRRFASVAAAGLFMGVPFDDDAYLATPGERAVDITPARPQRQDFNPDPESTSIVLQDFVDGTGTIIEGLRADEWVSVYREQVKSATLDQRAVMKAENEDAARAFYNAGEGEPMACWNDMASALDLVREHAEQEQNQDGETGGADGGVDDAGDGGSPSGPSDSKPVPEGDLLSNAEDPPAETKRKKKPKKAAEEFLAKARETLQPFVEESQLDDWWSKNDGALEAIKEDWPDVYDQITALCNTTRSAIS